MLYSMIQIISEFGEPYFLMRAFLFLMKVKQVIKGGGFIAVPEYRRFFVQRRTMTFGVTSY